MYVKTYTIYRMCLNEDEADYLREICVDALRSEDKLIQFTASQFIHKLVTCKDEAYCYINVSELMVDRFNDMIKTISPDMTGLLCIEVNKK